MRQTIANALLFATVGLAGLQVPAVAGDAAGPEVTVHQFNEAITARDMDTLMALLLDGGVQFNLRPSHQGVPDQGVTSELIPRWSMIGPVLFGATSAYTRKVDTLDVKQMGEIATVWVRVHTTTVQRSDNAVRKDEFTEVYLLANTPQGWKIAGVADNRQPDNIGMPAS
jgi:hypothetical protein